MFDSTADWIALGLLVLVLPAYHLLHPFLRVFGARYSAGKRMSREIKAWVQHTLDTGSVIVAVQQCRNLTMIASALASSTLIIMTLSASFLLSEAGTTARGGTFRLDPFVLKGLVLSAAFAVAFICFVQTLISIGRFTILIGCDRKTLDRNEGDAVIYLTSLFLTAIGSYRVGMNFLAALLPVLFWLFNPYICIGVTVLMGIKTVLWDDFPYLIRKRRRPDPNHTHWPNNKHRL